MELSDLSPGLAWCLDFSENMGNIVQINGELFLANRWVSFSLSSVAENDLDVVVQPGVGYEALNAELKEKGIPLMFPVDPAPGASKSFFRLVPAAR